MKFPAGYCVDIKGMHPQKFNKLLLKMKQDGYDMSGDCQDNCIDWRFVGVNQYREIRFHRHCIFYQDYNYEPSWNVLDSAWVDKYLADENFEYNIKKASYGIYKV